MTNTMISAVILLLIWVINGKEIIYGIKKKLPGEVYHHIGMGLVFTSIVIDRFYQISGIGFNYNILGFKIAGYILFITSIIFIAGSLYQLKIKNKAGSLSAGGSGRLVHSGVFSIVRHPMWLGFTILSLALVLIFQSLFSILFCIISIICFLMASIKEDDEGIKIFGKEYAEYMRRVPRWNLFKRMAIHSKRC